MASVAKGQIGRFDAGCYMFRLPGQPLDGEPPAPAGRHAQVFGRQEFMEMRDLPLQAAAVADMFVGNPRL